MAEVIREQQCVQSRQKIEPGLQKCRTSSIPLLELPGATGKRHQSSVVLNPHASALAEESRERRSACGQFTINSFLVNVCKSDPDNHKTHEINNNQTLFRIWFCLKL